jgi:hypothetical protein
MQAWRRKELAALHTYIVHITAHVLADRRLPQIMGLVIYLLFFAIIGMDQFQVSRPHFSATRP